ncbi:hypothetical protein [Aquariibacter albus]|uniref:Translesion DNA synthesis-associated protein ImuA n=1 Tax=Aquariibacter albus TaxID=2759899 RepID=A0A839HN28_9BURK|nr:hypothetical protein [Aquariibacter albus]MBB1161008.1 hypothetical protein [Aquariibacter albus]
MFSPASPPRATGPADALPRLDGLWRADRLAAASGATCPSGLSGLDAVLPGRGWPLGVLSELLIPAPASGELGVLAPLLRQHQAQPGAAGLLWVDPPHGLQHDGLAALGLAELPLLLLREARAADTAWAVEQALRSGLALAIVWWCLQALPALSLRRLQRAAQASPASLLVLLRPQAVAAQASPAPLRLQLDPVAGPALTLRLLKRQGPPLDRLLHLPRPHPLRLGAARLQPLGPAAPRPVPAPRPLPHSTGPRRLGVV